MIKKEKNKNTTFKEKIVIEETNIEEIKKYNNNDNKKEKLILVSIILLTIIDLILYFTGSSLGVLYIPIMCVVFVLLGIYNTMNNVYVSIIDNCLVFFDKKDFSHTVKIKEIKEVREKKSKIIITLKNETFVEIKSLKKEQIFEKIEKGILNK